MSKIVGNEAKRRKSNIDITSISSKMAADGLRNVTQTVNTIPSSKELDNILMSNCTDHRNKYIPDGLLYTPRGSDACRVCTCASGDPILCRTVLCAPPSHCKSIKVRDLASSLISDSY